jgi:hypothetical protein
VADRGQEVGLGLVGGLGLGLGGAGGGLAADQQGLQARWRLSARAAARQTA